MKNAAIVAFLPLPVEPQLAAFLWADAMAGDWIKMREDLFEDPAVLWMSDELGVRPETVVGFCHRFWGLVSRQTSDGCLHGVRLVSLGNVIGLPGFPELLVKAGWLEFDDSGEIPVVTIPKFERHLSESAKKRALRAEQKRKEREKDVAQSKRQMSHKSSDKSATREEKSKSSSKKEANASFCPEASREAPGLLTEFAFPVVGAGQNGQWFLPIAKLDEYRASYPHLDHKTEIRSAIQWCRDNPKRRKTARGMSRFLNGWMERAQNKGRGGSSTAARDPESRVPTDEDLANWSPHD